MRATLSNQQLNPAQIHFIQSLHFVKSEENMNELKRIVSDYYFQQLEKEADKWWDENDMTKEKFEAMIETK